MTFGDLKRLVNELSDFDLNQQVTVEEDGENYPLLLRNEGQMNLYFAPDHDEELWQFFGGKA